MSTLLSMLYFSHDSKDRQRGFVAIAILILATLATVAAGGRYYTHHRERSSNTATTTVFFQDRGENTVATTTVIQKDIRTEQEPAVVRIHANASRTTADHSSEVEVTADGISHSTTIHTETSGGKSEIKAQSHIEAHGETRVIIK